MAQHSTRNVGQMGVTQHVTTVPIIEYNNFAVHIQTVHKLVCQRCHVIYTLTHARIKNHLDIVYVEEN